MIIASYNVENLFERARAMNGATLAEGADALAWHAEVNALLSKANYTAADKIKIVGLLTRLGLAQSDDGGRFATLRQNRGHLVKRSGGAIEVVANGRSSWIGWVELKVEPVDETAVRNCARIIRDVNADVLAIVEAESRPALLRFSKNLLPAVGAPSYGHTMLIDGNDDRGIDVGLMFRAGYTIEWMRSHVDDDDGQGIVFSRDCAEYKIRTPAGGQFILLVNHLKSKGYGSQPASNARRLRQADRIRTIYNALVAGGEANVAVVGDFNDIPTSAPLTPLLTNTNLRDVFAHPTFNNGGRPGTYANCALGQKIDYILLSPPLFAAVTAAGVNRTGIWGGVNGTLFPHIAEVTKAVEAASDHAAVWADIAI
jgi:endonuclease/exonuclease/phosphatase family metal-dependent hydrolase